MNQTAMNADLPPHLQDEQVPEDAQRSSQCTGPSGAGCPLLHGVAHMFEGHDEAALPAFEEALHRDDSFWLARFLKAATLWHLEQDDLALTEGRLVFSHPTPARLADLLCEVAGWHDECRAYSHAVELYRQAIDASPEDADLHLSLAGSLERLGLDVEALEPLETAGRLDSELLAESRRQQVRILTRLGRDPEAWTLLDAITAPDPDEIGWSWPLRTLLAERLRRSPGMSPPQNSVPTRRRVQAVIANISLPDTVRAFENRVIAGFDIDGLLDATDTDSLLRFRNIRDVSWTGPRWMLPGDVLFFHFTKRALTAARKLARACDTGAPGWLARAVERAFEQATRYSGTIFAYGIVGGTAHVGHGDEAAHFDSRIFLPLAYVHVFDTPVSASDLRHLFQINVGAIGAHLNAEAFAGLKDRLRAANGPLDRLEGLEFGELRLDRSARRADWYLALQSDDVRFLYEEQVSEYFVEPLLRAISDVQTPIHKECVCEPIDPTAPGGRADYFVRIGGHWVPVEVKLNVRLAPDLLAQISRYTHLAAFEATRGASAGTRQVVQDAAVCLVVDGEGITVVTEGRFVCGDVARPHWSRRGLSSATFTEIRTLLLSLLSRNA